MKPLWLPVWKPGMRDFPQGIHPFYSCGDPELDGPEWLEPYAEMWHQVPCRYEEGDWPYGRVRCEAPAVVGAIDEDGTTWHRCERHRELDYHGHPAIAVQIAWTPSPAWQRESSVRARNAWREEEQARGGKAHGTGIG